MPSTWLGNDTIENILRQSFFNFDLDFSKLYETQARTNEERLTGKFIEKLVNNCKDAQASIQKLLNVFEEPYYFSLRYTDMAIQERNYDADMAFIFSTNIPSKMKCSKVILVQCKKMNPRPISENPLRFYPSWPINKSQAENLCAHSPFVYYFLYGPYSQGILTRVIPAKSILGIMAATGRKTTIPCYQAITSSKSFPDFFLNDFIGCWVGDEEEKIFRIATGDNKEISVRYLVELSISRG